MREEDARHKICESLLAACISSGMTVEDYERFCKCKGSACMKWCKKDVSETSKSETKPDGDGWEEADCVELPVRWFRWVAGGDCGLKHKSFKRVGDVEVSS